MPTARFWAKVVWFEEKIWVIGGTGGSNNTSSLNVVEVYDVITDSWMSGVPSNAARGGGMAWVANDRIYLAGGYSNGSYLNSIEVYNPASDQWNTGGFIPENKYHADAVTINNQVYIVAGERGSSDFSNKVYAADLLPHRDLYFRSVDSETLNRGPASIFALGDLSISENQPAGTIVVEFNATDPDGDSVTYSLVSGAGDTDNTLFALDANGQLSTTSSFDYESSAQSFTIRVQAKDDYNASTEENLPFP